MDFRVKNRGAKSNLLSLYLENHSTGKVHSKFKNGLNVLLGNSLIYIGCIGRPLSAFGLNIEEKKLNRLLDSARMGDIVVNKGERLFFYSVCETIIIDYKNAEQVDLRLPSIKCSSHGIKDTKLYNFLVGIEFERLIGIYLDELTSGYIDLLLNSNKSNLKVNTDIVRFFTGRGKGLTPGGDDILIGFTLALKVFGKFDSWTTALEAGVTSDRTTMISLAYLSALLRGYASEHFIQLVKLVDDGDMNAIEETIKEVQSFGHTSGNDTLFGFFLGMKYLSNHTGVDEDTGRAEASEMYENPSSRR